MISLAGCSVLPSQSYQERRDWPLVVRRPEALPARRNGKVLLVRTVSAAPELEARGLQWLRPDGSVHVDYYEQWAVPPAQAVDDDLRQWLAASGIYAVVLAPGSRLNADLVLEGELETFVADVPAGMARARLAVVLLDQRPNPAKVKLQQTFGATVQLSGGSIPELVDALRAALRDVLQQVELALRTA
jgi:cholesterol transport system auxiliary component